MPPESRMYPVSSFFETFKNASATHTDKVVLEFLVFILDQIRAAAYEELVDLRNNVESLRGELVGLRK